MSKQTKILIIFLASLVVFLGWEKWMLGKKTKESGATPTPTSTKAEVLPKQEPNYPLTLGNFLITNNDICYQDGKPVIYYFGSSTCPHCKWEEPIVKKVVQKFSGLISFHNNMDKQEDIEVFQKYSDINPGYIPFLVFGCKYARLGSGETEGEKVEEENLTALICKLTESKPSLVCEPLKEKIFQVK